MDDSHLIDPPEPNILGKCTYCDAELYQGCEYLQDRIDIEWYCDDGCYLAKLRNAGDISTDVMDG